jgi:transcriptional regulator with AAA-type ATPase domain
MALVALERGRAELPLPLGSVTVGQSRRCDLVVRGEGVHYRHATLRVEPRTAVVERSAPTADLRVNEVPVARAAVIPGDVLSLGTVNLRLESRRPAEVAPPAGGSPPAPTEPAPDSPDDVILLERLFEWSRERPLERRGAMLGLLVDHLRARGAALVLGGGELQLSLVNSWGEVAETLREGWVLESLQSAAQHDAADFATRGGWELATLALPGARSLGLVVGGRAQSWNPQLLRLCVRFFAHEFLRAELTDRPPRASGLPLAFPPTAVVGRASAMRRLYEEVGLLAEHQAPVLVQGETGTGKEAIARLIHDSSLRRALPFVVLDGSIGEEAFAAELERQLVAAHEPRKGERLAGTVLIDEVDRLSVAQQVRLMSDLDRLQRSATGVAYASGPRLVVSTQRQLEPAPAAGGGIRPDLYFRLAAFVLTVPPLRDRREDVPLLFDHYLLAELGAKRPALGPEALAALVRYHWPGNLRELRQEATRVAARAGSVVRLADLSPAVAGGDREAGASREELDLELHRHVTRLERELIRVAMEKSHGNLSRAAELLRVGRPWLRRRLRAFSLDR